MCIVYIADRYGVAIADISTGDYFVTELPDSSRLMDEIYKFSPSETVSYTHLTLPTKRIV